MGLDLYAGPLWRLYSGELLRPIQRMCGMKGEVIYAAGAKPLTRRQARQKVSALQKEIERQIKRPTRPGVTLSDWDENCGSYFSEQLGWDGWQSLMLLAAYNHRKDLVRPSQLPESLEDDPAYKDALPRKYYLGPMAVIEAQLFVPSTENFVKIVDEMLVTSTSNLAMILGQLRAEIWKDNVDIDGWFERGFAPANGLVMVQVGDGPQYRRVDVEPVADPVKHNGEYAFAVFTKALAFADEHNVPIKHDG